MTQFVHATLRGVFDSEALALVPFVDLMTIDQSLRHLQMPLFAALCDPRTKLPLSKPEFVGYGCANSDLILLELARLHHWVESGPKRDTQEALEAFSNELLSKEFETYPNVVQAFLKDVLIAKEKLKEWYRRRGITAPWPGASNDNTISHEPVEKILYPSNDESGAPNLGRPPKPAWVFIRRRSRELKRENRGELNKIIAAKVLTEAANDFCPEDLPAESTVLKEMGRILKGI